MKRIITVVILLLILTGITTFANTVDVETIIFNGSEIILKNNIIIVDNTIFVPMREIFESLGAEVYWFETRKEVIAYRNNMYVELTIDSTIGKKNGKAFTLDSAPFIIDGSTYVPLSFITEAFDFDLTIDSESKQAMVNSRERGYVYTYIDQQYLLKHSIAKWGAEISLPLHWYSIDDSVTDYGFKTDNLNYQLTLKTLPLKLDIPIESLANIYLGQLESESSLTMEVITEEKAIYNNMNYYVVNYELLSEEDVTEHFIYFLYVDGDAYIADFSFGLGATKADSKATFDQVMSTFNIYRSTVEQREEHYFESLQFHKLDIELYSELYANMTTERFTPFEGRFNHFTSYDGLVVKVSSDYEEGIDYFFIPIIDSVFNGQIYLTHGLGKHNIEVFGATLKKTIINEEEEDIVVNADENISLREKVLKYSQSLDDQYDLTDLLKLSIVNLSLNDSKYLYPTVYLDIFDVQVNSNANLFSYKSQSTYSKAKSLYKFVMENFTFVDYRTDSMNHASTTIKERLGDPLEITTAYVAMLRSIEIPARVVYGLSDNIPYYWAEIYYNGEWYVVDILASIDTNSQDFFHLSYTKYREIYSDIQVLNF